MVGLSLDATVDSGAGAPFAIGNSRAGETAPLAPAPQRLPPPPPPPPPNRVAAALPTAGARLVRPVRRRPSEPPYPEILKSQGIEADVTVVVRLDATGAVVAVEIARGSGYAELDRAARVAAAAEQFSPATRNGVAVPYTLSFTYHFRLESP